MFKRILLAIALLAAAPAFAETLRGERGPEYIRLFDTPCANDVLLASIPEELRGKAKAAEGQFTVMLMPGMGALLPLMAGCYVAAGDEYLTIWEDGDKIAVPANEFKPEGL